MFFNLKKKSLDEAFEKKKINSNYTNSNFLIGIKKTPPQSYLKMSFDS